MRSNSVVRHLPPMWRDLKTWPKVDEDALPIEQRDDFLRKRKAITALLAGAPYHEIYQETSYTSGYVRYLFHRCTMSDGIGGICGEAALVANTHLTSYSRTASVNRIHSSGRGYCAGALSQLFDEFPDIEEALEDEVLRQLPEGVKVSEARISILDVRRVFLGHCERIGRKAANKWPFNTKSLARSSIALFIKRLAVKHPSEFIRARHGKDASTMLNVGRGFDRLLIAQQPYDIVGLDELTFDAISTIVLPVPGGGEQDLAIERIHIVLVVEKVSTAICAWYAFWGASPTAADIRQALQRAITPWKPWSFSIPGLTYGSDDAGMPNGLIVGLQYHPAAVLVVDNALAHQDLAMLADIGRVTGCIVNLGPVGAWYRRADVERRIRDVLANSAQRLPSTTGNSPTDMVKDDPAGTAIRRRIRWVDVRQIVEVSIAQINATPSEGLGMLSPIALLRQNLDASKSFLRRPLPLASQTPKCLTTVFEEVPVKGSQADGRRPYVTVDRGTYTNKLLAKSWHLIGQKLKLAIDEDEFREIGASVVGSGVDLGILRVQGKWAHTTHTRKTKKAINSLRDRKVLVFPFGADPIWIYMEYLAATAIAESKPESKKKRVSRSGTKLASIEQRTGLTMGDFADSDASETALIDPHISIQQVVSTLPLRTSLRDLQWRQNTDDSGGT
jgi:putative transposase